MSSLPAGALISSRLVGVPPPLDGAGGWGEAGMPMALITRTLGEEGSSEADDGRQIRREPLNLCMFDHCGICQCSYYCIHFIKKALKLNIKMEVIVI